MSKYNKFVIYDVHGNVHALSGSAHRRGQAALREIERAEKEASMEATKEKQVQQSRLPKPTFIQHNFQWAPGFVPTPAQVRYSQSIGIVRVPYINLETPAYPWVPWDLDNFFPQYILNMAKAPNHSAILNAKTQLTYGNGLYDDKSDPALTEFLANRGAEGYPTENLNKVLRKCIYDYLCFGGFLLAIIWSRDGQRIAHISHVPIPQMRIGSDINFQTGMIRSFYLSHNWLRYTIFPNRPVCYPAFNQVDFKDKVQLYLYRTYNAEVDFYPMPSYYGAYYDIQTDYDISLHNRAYVLHGMNSTAHIHFNGDYDQETKDGIAEMFNAHFSSPENAGRPIVTHGSNASDSGAYVTVNTLNPGDGANIYRDLRETTIRNICTAHQFPPNLAGIQSSGLSVQGNSAELYAQLEILYKTVIQEAQSEVLEPFRALAAINNIPMEAIKIDSQRLFNLPITEQILSRILTINEIREKLGMPALTDAERKDLLIALPYYSAIQDTPGEPAPRPLNQDTPLRTTP